MHHGLPSLLTGLLVLSGPQDERRVGKTVEVEGPLIVATTAPEAIHAGMDVLDEGGSAVDGALATAFAQITLCAGCWVSFAGRLTAVVYDAESAEVVALNACYDVPLAEEDPLSIPRQPTPSGRTVMVPGFMAGAGALHERFGRVDFARLLAPSIRIAAEGVTMTPNLARLIRGKREVLLRTEQGRDVFLNADGELHPVGSLFRQPQLAQTLERTARGGVGEFVTGEWANRFIEVVQAEGGKITLDDLRRYRPTWHAPLTTTYRGTTIHGLPTPNRGGPSTVLALNLASRFSLFGDQDPATSAAGLYSLARIERAVFMSWTGRGRAALQEFAPGTERLWQESYADSEAADRLHAAMTSSDWSQAIAAAFGPRETDDHSDAVVCADSSGNVIAMIHTINTAGWGTTGLFVDGVSIPDSGASQQRAMLAAGPGGRVPDHGVPLIGTRYGKVVFASSATGSGNVQASWQNALRVLGCGRSVGDVADGPNLYAGRVQTGAYPAAAVAEVRDLGFPLEEVEQLPGHQIGYWVGLSIDPQSSRVHGACLKRLDGVAIGAVDTR